MTINIIFFSGTGTTAHLVRALIKQWASMPDLTVRPITAEKALVNPAMTVEGADALVLGYPVYDYLPPDIIRKLTSSLPIMARPIPVAQFATYGISPGMCFVRGAGDLRKRGYHPVAGIGFKAPAPIAALYARADKFPFSRLFRFGDGVPDRLEKFASEIVETFHRFNSPAQSKTVPDGGFFKTVMAAAVPGPAISRGTFGRAFYRNLKVSENCTACGICVHGCPDGNLFLQDGRAEVRFSNGCLRCMRCVVRCPAGAVDFTVRRRIGNIPDNGWDALYEASRNIPLEQE